MPPTARSFFLHTIPNTLLFRARFNPVAHTHPLGASPAPSSTPSPRHHPTHPPKPSRERVAASSFTRSPPPSLPRSLHQHPVAHTHKQGIYNPGIIFHHLSVALSLHGACRRNTAPRETHAHNTPHATPSTDKSCTSRIATRQPRPRSPGLTLQLCPTRPIHPSKARCVQVFRHDNAKRARKHADAEKRGLAGSVPEFQNVRCRQRHVTINNYQRYSCVYRYR